MFPMVGESRSRGHSFRTDVRRNIFAQRVVNVWNSLPQNVTEAKTSSDFKIKLDITLGAQGSRDTEGRVDQDIEFNDEP